MLKYGNRELRNLEDQVEKNAQDIEDFKNGNQTIAEFGIYVVGILASVDDLPAQGENFGDAYLIGSQPPYDMHVWTRDVANNTAKWVDLGAFPLKGDKGDKGDIGSVIRVDSGEPLNNPTSLYDFYLDSITGYWYAPYLNETGYGWLKVFTLKGEKGDRGLQGIQGVQGVPGVQGKPGAIGDTGAAFNVQGTLASSSNLPTPTAEMQDKGYAYIIPDSEGTKHIWVIQGSESTSFSWVDVGTAGVGIQGEKGADGIGLNNLTDTDLTYGDVTVTYNTTDGIGINGTMRQTYGDTNHDSTVDMNIPLVPGNGILINKQAGTERVEVKIDSSKVIAAIGFTTYDSMGNQSSLYPDNIQYQDYEGNQYMLAFPLESGTLTTDGSFKTIFGKSIVGSGNLNLYVHNMTFHLPDGDCYGRWISSNDLNLNSLTNIKTVFGNTFKLPLFGDVPKSGGVAIMLTETNLIMDTLTWTYSDFTFVDDVKTV